MSPLLFEQRPTFLNTPLWNRVTDGERLEALRRYDIVDSDREDSFDFIAELAADLFNTPIALINLIEEDRQWFKSNIGFKKRETGLEFSFCIHALDRECLLVVEDLAEDERFAQNPYVTDEGLRFYAGAPLVTPDGYRIGTLCVLDKSPRTPAANQLQRLKKLAALLVDELELRRENEVRKQTETVLRRSKRRYETLFESAGEAILVHDQMGRITDANRQAHELFEASDGQLIGKTLFDLHPSGLKEVPRQKLKALKRGEQYSVISEYRRLDGERFWGDLEATAVEIEGELYMRSMIQDVTRQRAVEQSLRRQKEELQTLIDNVPVMIAFFDAEGTPQVVNERVSEVLGWTQEDVEENPDLLERLFPDVEALEKAHKHIREAPETWKEFEIRTKRGDDIATQVTTTKLADGRRIGIGLDVSEKKDREEELRLLKAAIENSRVPVLITEAKPLDEPGPSIVYTNPVFSETTGYSKEEIGGENPRILQGPETDGAALDRIREALEAEEPIREIVRNYKKDGTPFWNDIFIAPIPDEEGMVTHFVSTQADVTEQVRRREELEEAKEEAEEANRTKSALLSNMNHEFRTPLTSIISFSEIIKKNPELAEKFAGRILGGGQRLLRTLNAVMDFAQLEGGQVNLTEQTVDLREVVSSVVNDFRADGQKKGISLQTELPKHPVTATLDPHHVERISTHLLSNAVKFTEEGHITIGVGSKDRYVEIWVEDTGIGITPDAQSKVFDEFVQASQGYDRTHEGNGIGLTVAKRLTEKMNGSICLESTPGEGTLVTVTFPRSW